MKKQKKLKVVYEYIEPKTPEEKADQERRLQKVYGFIFDEITRLIIEEKKQK